MIADKPVGLIARNGPIPLEGVAISGEVFGGCARVRVAQRYCNRESHPVEAIYTFPMPSDSVLVGFAMTFAGRRIDGVVREREEAFRQYDEAISAGHGAALLEPERPNIFTAQVGNLLPGEETLVEVDYAQRLSADEGTLRWAIPTLVAPRYIPSRPLGDRTGHGRADPTDRVPDADRITPPVGAPTYGLKMDLLFDAGPDSMVESPSHAIRVAREGERVRVTFAQAEVGLDRDVVLTVRHAAPGPLTAVAAHREGARPGVFALTVVPDLFDPEAAPARQTVQFVIDVSGSMNGASIVEARAALRLCLRHLREGDCFNIVAFNHQHRSFSEEPVPLTQATLERADRWVDALKAEGGTELVAPLIQALDSSPDVVMLLTDGQVGNESEILARAERARGRARVYSFGIGTNVSDVVLRDLARRTSGGVEFIHPGERIDEKVVAQFARAIASRVADARVSFHGVEIKDLAPELPGPLIDGEPWLLMGCYSTAGRGHVEIRGHLRGEPFLLKIPIELPEHALRPQLEKLWARERIRDLEDAQLSGRPAEAVRDRILKLALEHGVASRYTSFVAIEQRTDERRATGQPRTRVVPVHAPAGWAMFEDRDELWPTVISARRGAAARPTASVSRGLTMAAMAPSRAGRLGGQVRKAGFVRSMAPELVGRLDDLGNDAPLVGEGSVELGFGARKPRSGSRPGEDPIAKLLGRQLASGLWSDGPAADETRQVRATALALLELVRAGITTAHAQYGPQVRKAIEALLELAVRIEGTSSRLAELVFAVAWLAASGPRTRARIDRALCARAELESLRARLQDQTALRAHVDSLAEAI